jgi:hypothetical protein
VNEKMSTHFRALWVFDQTCDHEEAKLSLVAARRFRTVEMRYKAFRDRGGSSCTTLPSDEIVSNEFSSCILGRRSSGPLILDGLTPSLAPELEGRVFQSEDDSQFNKREKEWPLGPTLTIGGCWPFIFVSTDLNAGAKFWICGLVAILRSPVERPLIELPEVTAAYGVLEDIKSFLPTTSNPDKQSIARFMFLLKSALPFGSPICTTLDILTQTETISLTANDALLSNQTSTGARASLRVPAWKPFPLLSGGGSSAHLKLHLVESVSFEVLDGEVRMCSVSGKLFCANDIHGIPEIIIPIHVDLPHQVLTLHDCAKFATSSSSSNEDIQKISFVPPNENFTLCSFVLASPLKTAPFPIDLSFSLLQVAPTQFKFTLTAKLRVLFAQFSIAFCVNETLQIANLNNLSVSPRCKAEVHNETHVMWTFRNPSTYSDGEVLSGVIETQRPLSSGEEISRFAIVSFRITNDHFSNIKILKEGITFFPTNSKISSNISYETVSTGGCVILNSALDNGPSVSIPIDLTDCLTIGV